MTEVAGIDPALSRNGDAALGRALRALRATATADPTFRVHLAHPDVADVVLVVAGSADGPRVSLQLPPVVAAPAVAAAVAARPPTGLTETRFAEYPAEDPAEHDGGLDGGLEALAPLPRRVPRGAVEALPTPNDLNDLSDLSDLTDPNDLNDAASPALWAPVPAPVGSFGDPWADAPPPGGAIRPEDVRLVPLGDPAEGTATMPEELGDAAGRLVVPPADDRDPATGTEPSSGGDPATSGDRGDFGARLSRFLGGNRG